MSAVAKTVAPTKPIKCDMIVTDGGSENAALVKGSVMRADGLPATPRELSDEVIAIGNELKKESKGLSTAGRKASALAIFRRSAPATRPPHEMRLLGQQLHPMAPEAPLRPIRAAPIVSFKDESGNVLRAAEPWPPIRAADLALKPVPSLRRVATARDLAVQLRRQREASGAARGAVSDEQLVQRWWWNVRARGRGVWRAACGAAAARTLASCAT